MLKLSLREEERPLGGYSEVRMCALRLRIVTQWPYSIINTLSTQAILSVK